MASRNRSERLKVLGNVGLVVLAAATVGGVAAVALPGATPPPVSEKVQKYYDESQARYANPTTAPEPKKVAFIGDSYSAGTGTTLTVKRWTSVLSQTMGWNEINFARGGTGYETAVTANAMKACGLEYCPNYLEMVPEVVAAAPEVVVVAGGRNDGASADPQRVAAVFAELRKGLPNAKIIALNPVWAAEDVPPAAGSFAVVVSDAVRSSGGSFVDVGQPLDSKPDLITADRVHPNDAGHGELAAVTAAALKAQGII